MYVFLNHIYESKKKMLEIWYKIPMSPRNSRKNQKCINLRHLPETWQHQLICIFPHLLKWFISVEQYKPFLFTIPPPPWYSNFCCWYSVWLSWKRDLNNILYSIRMHRIESWELTWNQLLKCHYLIHCNVPNNEWKMESGRVTMWI